MCLMGTILMKGTVSAQGTQRPSSQYMGDFFAPEGQRTGVRDKDRRKMMRETVKRTREKRQDCLSWRDNGVPLNKEETDESYRKMVYKRGTPC